MSEGSAIENVKKEVKALETQLQVLEGLKTPEEGAEEFVKFVVKTNEPFSPSPLETVENPWKEANSGGGCCVIS